MCRLKRRANPWEKLLTFRVGTEEPAKDNEKSILLRRKSRLWSTMRKYTEKEAVGSFVEISSQIK